MRLIALAVAIIFVLPSCRTVDRNSQTSSFGKKKNGPVTGDFIPESEYPKPDKAIGEKHFKDEYQNAKAIADILAKSIEKKYLPGAARRDAHPKAHGCVKAKMSFNSSIPLGLQSSIIKPNAIFDAIIRFSNGNGNPKRADIEGDGRGMAVKLLGVDKKVPSATQSTQDFIMINHPQFVMNDPDDYRKVVAASDGGHQLKALFHLGLRGASVALKLQKIKIASPLEEQYFSMVPYQLGLGNNRTSMKFSAKPCTAGQSTIPENPTNDYLREKLVSQLDPNSGEEACFKFMIQKNRKLSNGKWLFEVEDSIKEWKQSKMPFIEVATILIPKQDFDTRESNKFCENLSFTPWHNTADHKPLGAINRLRKVIYEHISKVRHQINRVPRQEPK